MTVTLKDLTNPKCGDFNECFALIMEDEQCYAQLQYLLAVGVHYLGATDNERFKGDLHIPAKALLTRMLDLAYEYCGERDEETLCSMCRGSGIGQYGDPDTSKCNTCNGSGMA